MKKITYALINGQDEFIKSITLINDFLEEERNKIDDQYALDQIIQEETTVDSTAVKLMFMKKMKKNYHFYTWLVKKLFTI